MEFVPDQVAGHSIYSFELLTSTCNKLHFSFQSSGLDPLLMTRLELSNAFFMIINIDIGTVLTFSHLTSGCVVNTFDNEICQPIFLTSSRTFPFWAWFVCARETNQIGINVVHGMDTVGAS